MAIDHQHILANGTVIHSSGTTGQPTAYFQSPAKLASANRVAIEAQKILPSSKIYTCCKTTHAGGLLAQTLPGLSIGATVDVVAFDPYKFVQEIGNYTHTHLAPLHARAIMLTKKFKNLDLSGIWVTCGSDPVSWDIIEAFVERGAIFMANWGMSEVGPITINTTFDSMHKVQEYKAQAPTGTTILGDIRWCQTDVINDELHVNGDICIYDHWYKTKDKVITVNNILYYVGRIFDKIQ